MRVRKLPFTWYRGARIVIPIAFVWKVPTGAPYISSLVYHDGLLYMAADVGVVTCIEAKTGERVWQERLEGVFTASPVAADGKIYLVSESGETIVLRPGRKADVIGATRSTAGCSRRPRSLAGDCSYARTRR
jgi:outer membrane protein assembly factor BamB